MIAPEKPENEADRLATLYQLNILDTNREERFDRVTRIACKLFSVPIAVISFIEVERQWIKSSQGFEIQEAKRKTSFCGHVILSNEVMIIEDAKKDARFFDNPYVLGDPRIRFYLGCPLRINDYNVGVLCLIDDKPRMQKSIDERAVWDLAQMLELELETVQLSLTDELTGLTNRRGFLKIANYQSESCVRRNMNYTVLFFDLNKFKSINDTYGHAEGDRVLKIFSNLLLRHFRGYDVIARLGGDEFCVFCTGLEQYDMDSVIKRLKNSLAQIETSYPIEFSVGYVNFDKEKYKSLEDMLAVADSKMYKNKGFRYA